MRLFTKKIKEKAKFIFLILIIMNSLDLFAETRAGTPNEVFGPLPLIFIQKAIDQGYVKLGDLDLKLIQKNLKGVEWRIFPDIGFISGSGGERNSSIYIVKEKMVVINSLGLNQSIGKKLDEWLLHEALGASGYYDENYQITSIISYLVNSNLQYEAKKIRALQMLKGLDLTLRQNKEPQYNYFPLSTSSGGGTVVGGGGDIDAIIFKSLCVQFFDIWIEEKNITLPPLKIDRALQRLINVPIKLSNHLNYSSSEEQDKVYWNEKNEIELTPSIPIEPSKKEIFSALDIISEKLFLDEFNQSLWPQRIEFIDEPHETQWNWIHGQ